MGLVDRGTLQERMNRWGKEAAQAESSPVLTGTKAVMDDRRVWDRTFTLDAEQAAIVLDALTRQAKATLEQAAGRVHSHFALWEAAAAFQTIELAYRIRRQFDPQDAWLWDRDHITRRDEAGAEAARERAAVVHPDHAAWREVAALCRHGAGYYPEARRALGLIEDIAERWMSGTIGTDPAVESAATPAGAPDDADAWIGRALDAADSAADNDPAAGAAEQQDEGGDA